MLSFIRIWLPGVICFAGLGVIVARGGDETGMEGGAAIIGAGLSVALLNYLYRVGVTGDRERRSEDDARDYFEEHGQWPDEAAPKEDAPPGDPHAAPHREEPVTGGHPRPPAERPPRRPT